MIRKATSLLLLLSYPFSVHYGVISGRYAPAIAILMLLMFLPLLSARLAHRPWLWPLPLAAIVAAGWWLGTTLHGVLYLPPLLMPLLPLLLFARSLLPGRTPFVTRIARLMHEAMTPRIERYTRWVSWGWVIVLAVIVVETLLVSLFASRELWSLMTNLVNYLLVGGFFLIELLLRRLLLPPQERIGVREFARAMLRIDFREVIK